MSIPKPPKPWKKYQDHSKHRHDIERGNCTVYDPKDFSETKAKQVEEMNR